VTCATANFPAVDSIAASKYIFFDIHSNSSEFTICTTVVFPFVVICNGDIIVACLSVIGGTQILVVEPEFNVADHSVRSPTKAMNIFIFLFL
jgi:hypothetical protein